MFSFESFLNLPILWFVIIATAVILYVLLDGFDLGGWHSFSLCSFRSVPGPDDELNCSFLGRHVYLWLVLGGGGLFAAFPLAYAVVMPALYIPVIHAPRPDFPWGCL